MTLEERFDAKVCAIGSGGCWEWTAGKFKEGYGVFAIDRKSKYAHRVSWELHNGPIPNGLCVLHTCDNPGCVNPDHLWLGTKKDNAIDCVEKGRHSRAAPKGERQGLSKLTESDVKKIRKFAGRMSQSRIGTMFGVNQQTISDVVNGKTWTHVT